MKRIQVALMAAALFTTAAPSLAQQDHGNHTSEATQQASDTAAVAAVADALNQAIVAGDRAAVEKLLLPEAKIHEGGQTETRAEYFGHHFGADGTFLRAMTREPLSRTFEIDGHTAQVTSISRLHGTYGDNALDLESTEVLVLRHTPEGGWRVAEVHWTSRPSS
ncbi:MAG TPA: nuclear transport factor 2 family protein [Longimicrobiaceae bacterium]|nr:nuclear transport factor 2 family protein [Longimicrobiaceae bacterium]